MNDRDYPTTAAQLGIGSVQMNYPTPPQVVAPLTRERYVELVALAMDTVAWLESKGLKMGEQCEFRQIAERLWFAPKGA